MYTTNFLSDNNPIVLFEGGQRGFLSNYLTILTSFHHFEKLGISSSNIKISSSMFSLYGNPINWFDSDKIVDQLSGIAINAVETHIRSNWSEEELTSSKTLIPFRLLSKYSHLFPLNKRMTQILKSYQIPSHCLGVHYRGTDHPNAHSHSKAVKIEIFLENIDEKIYNTKYKNIFLATDEDHSAELIKNYCEKKHGITPLINKFIRSSSSIPIHRLPLNKEDKIKIGDQVIIDAFCISKCSSVICRDSNIINYASILNPSLITHYLDI